MSRDFELSLVMRLRDMASRAATRAMSDIQAGIARTDKTTANLTRTVSQYQKTRDAAAVLGIRSERDIQREIQRTEASYNRLARSGTMSMRDQARAAEATRNRVRELNNEMGKFTIGQRAMRGLQGGAAVGAGMMAGGYVMSKPVGQTMDYGMRLAYMSNTAYDKRGLTGRIAGKSELNDTIKSATRYGGGTRESAAAALEGMIASGAVPVEGAKTALPGIMRASTAANADASDLTQIVAKGIQTFGIRSDQTNDALNIAHVGGKEGSFELKDQARWLPSQMAAAKSSGMYGLPGLAKLVAANQAAATTAGNSDEAGNNVRNLLLKINSRDTATDASNLGINLSGSLAAAREKGVDSLDAFIGVVDGVVAKNGEFQALQAKLKTASGSERRAILESQANILQGSAIGKIIQDQQALLALAGIMGNRKSMSDIQKTAMSQIGAQPGMSAIDQDYAVIAEEAGFKTQQASNEKAFATQNAFENLTPLVGAVADGFSAIAQEYPNLTAATVAATTALVALAAAAGGASLAGMLGGGGKGKLLTGILARAKGLVPAAGGLLVRGGGAMLTGAGLATTAAVSVAGGVGYSAGTLAYNHGLKGTESGETLGGTIATMLAWMGNREAQRALQINLHLDGEQIATVVNNRNTRTASRN